jgi:Protein of unknown function (DUF2971)
MKLYKYVPFARIDCLQGLKIRLTQATDFNDPFDLSPTYDIFSQEDYASFVDVKNDAGDPTGQKQVPPEIWSRAISATSKGQEILMNRYRFMEGTYALDNNEAARLQLATTFGVLSLSQNHDNFLMWSHYADQHKGFVIEFETGNNFFNPLYGHNLPAMLGRVEYSDVRPHLSYSTLNRPEAMFRKNSIWSYENEWRLVRYLEQSDETFHRENNLPIHLFRFGPSAVSAIYTGAKMVHEEYVELTSLVSNSEAFKHVRIHHMQLNSDEFRLDTTPPLPGQEDPTAINGRVVSARPFRV